MADVRNEVYRPGFNKEIDNAVFGDSPEKHKRHKWVMMYDGLPKKESWDRKAKYCDPDNFGMIMYTDWRGWGMQEIVENMMVEFDRGFRKKGEGRLNEMWAVISGLGLWLNTSDHIGALIANEDGQTTCELIGLVGWALLTTLTAIDRAGQLNRTSRFLDLALVIGYYLRMSHDLPEYGIEGECVSWRREAVRLFEKGNLDHKKGLADTTPLLEKLATAPDIEMLEGVDSDKENSDPHEKSEVQTEGGKQDDHEVSEHDPWEWDAKYKAYKHMRRPKMGGTHYDIKKMTRADRAAATIQGKDPLADVPVKDLKDDLIDFE